MKTTFDCDRTFDRLTAGLLLAGSPEAAEIDAHIASCEACRNLANALRPATHLVHEALVDGGLPVYVPPEERHVQRVMASIESLPLENADSTRSRENGEKRTCRFEAAFSPSGSDECDGLYGRRRLCSFVAVLGLLAFLTGEFPESVSRRRVEQNDVACGLPEPACTGKPRSRSQLPTAHQLGVSMLHAMPCCVQ